MTGKVLSALIDFHYISNTDIGLLRLIREKYEDERVFKLDILNKSDREILSLLYFRTNWNPLSIISTDSNMENIDVLYNSFFSKYEEEIIQKSIMPVSIYNFVNTVLTATGAGVAPVLCAHNDLERSALKKKKKKARIVNYAPSEITTKDLFYVKDYRFFTELDISVMHKHIYCIYSKYNADYFMNTESVLTRSNEIFNVNTIHKTGEK